MDSDHLYNLSRKSYLQAATVYLMLDEAVFEFRECMVISLDIRIGVRICCDEPEKFCITFGCENFTIPPSLDVSFKWDKLVTWIGRGVGGIVKGGGGLFGMLFALTSTVFANGATRKGGNFARGMRGGVGHSFAVELGVEVAFGV
uniref:Uncharacterized protein n=1 Tax=Glossina austeni TaxID=7395 RepID=A0A1A9VPE6_GLOAU